jgi:integrase/recombinase XerD
MTPLPALLQGFFTDRLMRQRQASGHTIAAYRDTFRLLLAFATETLGQAPSDLALEDLDATVIGEFLDHLQKRRGNSARTRNARLAAIRSFYSYVALTEPACSLICQRVLAIPGQVRFLLENREGDGLRFSDSLTGSCPFLNSLSSSSCSFLS